MEKNESLQNIPSNSFLEDSSAVKSISDFNKFLDKKPNKSETEVNELANDSLYLPIDVIEKKLDQLFNKLWHFRIVGRTVVVNEIVYDVELTVFHPIARVWLTRAGTGAAQIRMRNYPDQKSSPLNVEMKIKNSVEADAPHALANALKNAAKRFGSAFGRDLNREDSNERYYEAMIPTEEIATFNIAMDELDSCVTTDDIKIIFDNYPQFKGIPAFKNKAINKAKEIKNEK